MYYSEAMLEVPETDEHVRQKYLMNVDKAREVAQDRSVRFGALLPFDLPLLIL